MILIPENLSLGIGYWLVFGKTHGKFILKNNKIGIINLVIINLFRVSIDSQYE